MSKERCRGVDSAPSTGFNTTSYTLGSCRSNQRTCGDCYYQQTQCNGSSYTQARATGDRGIIYIYSEHQKFQDAFVLPLFR
jgi:hypothetical protein